MPVPCSIAAGSTLLFTETLIGYPATLYMLAFILNRDGVLTDNIAASASGDDFVITQTAEVTGLWYPGRYNWSEVVTKISDSNVKQLCLGQISITPNFAATAPKSSTQLQLDAINAAILSLLSGAKAATFNGQSVTQRDMKEMFDARDRLQAQVDAELRAAGLSQRGGSKTIVTQFRKQ